MQRTHSPSSTCPGALPSGPVPGRLPSASPTVAPTASPTVAPTAVPTVAATAGPDPRSSRGRSVRAGRGWFALAAAVAIGGCASSGPAPVRTGPAQPGAIRPGACVDIARSFTFRGVVLTESTVQSAGPLQLRDRTAQLPSHCLVRGRMNERTSAVDGKVYAIGFEMRLPDDWNGRFLYQGNGGLDGVVVPAIGPQVGGPLGQALAGGFAVISSDAGHAQALGPFFGLDPQARLDYGYRAVGELTPMAKSLINLAYGRAPDRSYIAGCSNGGRHAMVAAARHADQYDGFLAGNPGFNLPKAAVAQLYGVQQYARIATNDDKGLPDLRTAVTPREFALIGQRIVEKCDALDGAKDGMVLDTVACQAAFDLRRDVPTCSGERDGTCLSAPQKTALAHTFDGATNGAGAPLYAKFWFDPGIAGANWAFWELNAAQNLDPGAVAFIFMTPPLTPEAFAAGGGGLAFARGFAMDTQAQGIYATTEKYPVSSMRFMTPPGLDRLEPMVQARAKLIVYHGVADAVFSAADTAAWYRTFDSQLKGQGDDHARLFLVPQMNHCSGGPAADRFDLLTPLVKWVEEGIAPALVEASVRGPQSAEPNAELPADWSANRTRPLCPYPKSARYKGSGDVESAASFYCADPKK